MTGFARTSGAEDWGSWVWEAKSVNGKGLDARINTPSGLDGIEKAIKTAVSERFTRGNFQIGLRIEASDPEGALSVNKAALKALMDAYEQADQTIATGPALATLMSIKGVTEATSSNIRTLAENNDAIAALTSSGIEALELLKTSRAEEGEKLKNMLVGHLSEIGQLTKQATAFAKDQTLAIKEVFRQRIAELDVEGVVSEERLAGEIAILAAKADVSEEFDRLQAHVESGQSMLTSKDAIGRSLGFLAQELNREANTLCSKSASLDLTNVGLALKTVIDQFKEQAANVE
ncbi:MAG: YicC family protein [Henriciella sp.]